MVSVNNVNLRFKSIFVLVIGIKLLVTENISHQFLEIKKSLDTGVKFFLDYTVVGETKKINSSILTITGQIPFFLL